MCTLLLCFLVGGIQMLTPHIIYLGNNNQQTLKIIMKETGKLKKKRKKKSIH